MNVRLISITQDNNLIQKRIMDLLTEYSDNLDNTNEEMLKQQFNEAMNSIFSSNNIISYIANFARVCTNRDEIKTNIENDYNTCIKLWNNKHLTPLESINIDFIVEDVSRALLAQITRYRHTTFGVESQRYCNYKNKDIEYVLPEKLLTIKLL